MKDNKQVICVCCNRTVEWDDAQICPYCGASLFNYCTNPDCEMCPTNSHYEDDWSLKWDFKFCPECGSKTTFCDFSEESDLPQKGQ